MGGFARQLLCKTVRRTLGALMQLILVGSLGVHGVTLSRRSIIVQSIIVQYFRIFCDSVVFSRFWTAVPQHGIIAVAIIYHCQSQSVVFGAQSCVCSTW